MQIFGEFMGTFILITLGSGIGASLNLKKTLGAGGGWIMVSLGWGLAVMFGVMTANFMSAPGYLNPAVTIAQAVGGLCSWTSVFPFILAQTTGAFLGATFIIILYYPHFKITKELEGNTVAIFATRPAIPNTFFNLLSEVMVTFIFVFCTMIFGEIATGLNPMIVGLLVTSVGFSLGSTTGYAMNPARDFGPRLAYALLPIPNKGRANFSYAWIPILGPIVGAVLAVLTINLIKVYVELN